MLGVAPGLEAIEFDAAGDLFQLNNSGLAVRVAGLAQQVRRHDGGKYRNQCDDDDEFDQGEAFNLAHQ